jgi:hypothetical protein
MSKSFWLGGVLVLATAAAAPVAIAQTSQYGALAVDESQGYQFGFSHDYPNQVDAERRAREECAANGGSACRLVLLWSGAGCGAYRSISSDGFAYGWGVSGTRAAAEAIADRELAERSNGRLAEHRAWACNAGTDALAILVEEAPGAAPSGPLVFTDADGERYEYTGPLRNGVPHGVGVATYPKGDRYEGGFVDGSKQGRGVYSWPSGARYEGDFAGDTMHGQGSYRFASGKRYVGELRDGKLEGYGRYYDAGGSMTYEGQWRNNKPVD